MIDVLAVALIVASLALAAWCLLLTVLNRTIDVPQLIGLAAVEVGLLAQTVIGIVLLSDHQPDEMAQYLAYQLGILVVLPAGTFLGLAERSRWGSAVVVVACLAVPVMIIRLQQIWQGSGA